MNRAFEIIRNNKLMAQAIYWVFIFVVSWQIGKQLSIRLFNISIPEQYLFLGLLTVVPLAALISLKPFWALCSLYFFSYFDELLVIGKDFTIFKILGPLFIILWVMNLMVRESSGKGENKITLPFPILLLGMFLIWALFSYFWAAYPELVWGRWVQFFMMTGLIFITVQLTENADKLKVLLHVFVLGSAVLGLMGLYQFSLNPFVRVSGLGNPVDAGHFAVALLMAIFYFFLLYLFGKTTQIRIISSVCFFLFVLCGVFGGTRIFLIDLAVGLFIVFATILPHFKKYRQLQRRWLAILAISLVIFMIMFTTATLIITKVGVFALGLAYKNINTIALEEALTASVANYNVFRRFSEANPFEQKAERHNVRYAVWEVYKQGFAQYYLYGIGLANSPLYFGKLVSEYAIDGFETLAASKYADVSNIYFQLLIELGFVGLILFLCFIWFLIKKYRAVMKKIPVCSTLWQMGLLVGVNFATLLTTGVYWSILNRKYFWFGLTLLVVFINIAKRKQVIIHKEEA